MSDDDEGVDIKFGSADETTYNGIWRRVFDDCVTFQPDYLQSRRVQSWDYAVIKYPFVPGFHVVQFANNYDDDEYVLSTHKTLHEAMGVCRVLLANGGVTYD